MLSDDDLPLVGRSPSPAAPRGKGSGKGERGGGKAGDRGPPRGRTTGRELPTLNSIHKGTVVRVQSFGAFVRLGDGSKYKDGLLHISRLSASGRVEKVEDVVANDDVVWVKVCEVREEEGKFSVDMRFVGQKDGEDKDPNNTQADSGGGKGKGKPTPIRIGAVQATTCSRCGARGHSARECWAAGGTHYDLLEEPPASERVSTGPEGSAATLAGHPTEVARRALKAYIHGKDDLLSDEDEKKTKKAKKEKKKGKKEKKKEKKEKKK
mmetsp:Transcript_13961/g.25782  ORF Transcript_13961/g.25782 Transcript_13961/m.25782 type:complete len:266 (-) Transcript_13961:85-882(-)